MTRRELLAMAGAAPVETAVTSAPPFATPDGFEVTFTAYYRLVTSPAVARIRNVDPGDIQEP